MSEDTKSTLKTVLITGLLALLGTVAGGVVKGYWDVRIAEQKLYSDLIMKALESNSPKERLASLDFMVKTNLIQESNLSNGLRQYVQDNKKDPSAIPQMKSPITLSKPMIENVRVFLLAGKNEKTPMFRELKDYLVKSGYNVLGEKIVYDEGRPVEPEIRYFNPSDKAQAEAIAKFVRFRLSDDKLVAQKTEDSSARPGYIEIWLGK